MKYGLHGAIIAGLVAVPAIWSSVDKSVHLEIDGRTVSVNTTAGTVGQVLAERKLHVTGHDIVAPSEKTHLKDGAHIVLRHGRLLHLSIDGRRTDVWTTAPTVADALTALGYSAADFVSVSRDRRLPLSPTSLAIRTPQLVTVVHDGQRQAVTTTDATVGELLTDLGVPVGAQDKLSAPTTSAITAGATITLKRVTQKTLTKTEALAYRTSKKSSATMESGTTKVLTPGKKGTARVTYALVYIDGKLAGTTKLSSVTVAAPTTQVVAVGTKKITDAASQPAPDPGSAKAYAKTLLASRGWGDDQYDCLVAMWNHESGWRLNAANPSGAYGIPQALPGSKMASAGPNWQTDFHTQVKWGVGYVADRYGTPCGAWSFWQAHNYY